MLFNSYTFIFAFLPLTLLVFWWLAAHAPRRVAIVWLIVASIFFYGWYRYENLLLLGVLLVLNYWAGVYLGRHSGARRAKAVLVLGIMMNLGTLGYFKYANFFIDAVNRLFPTGWSPAAIVLPLGISFFIFQKIAYLVDAYRGKARGYSFIDYCLFVTFFPQLIAGPIVHHAEVVPQFSRQSYRPNAEDFSVGLTQFFCGLFKKVLIADRMALYASPIFESAAGGGSPGFIDAWIAALAYTFQLYFDFSGYSDMALGLGRLFGIKLPQNFASPYKAVNITEFWRCWHMTLSRFLRDYLYIPLGGNRQGPARRYVNLMLTMLIGGLWHGAGWNFVVWGGLHGLYLVIHHAWRAFRSKSAVAARPSGLAGIIGGRALTFLAVVLAWIFFRAADTETAGRMLAAMFGSSGFTARSAFELATVLPALGVVALIVWGLPNTQEWLARYQPALGLAAAEKEAAPRRGLVAFWSRLAWQPNPLWAVLLAALAVFTFTQMSNVSEFIYWQF
jgi:alginate O-acetyltransferase complex protein AlgI